jgi:hypothetical protein
VQDEEPLNRDEDRRQQHQPDAEADNVDGEVLEAAGHGNVFGQRPQKGKRQALGWPLKPENASKP